MTGLRPRFLRNLLHVNLNTLKYIKYLVNTCLNTCKYINTLRKYDLLLRFIQFLDTYKNLQLK